MVKPPRLTQAEIEAFASGADATPKVELDRNAPRKFKELKIGLNEYEYHILMELSKRTHRGVLNTIRWSLEETLKRLDDV